jgi:hypothetical protein
VGSFILILVIIRVMEISIILARIIGVYLIIDGLAAIMMQKEIIPIVSELKGKAVFFGWGIMATIFGLIIITTHNIWLSPHQTVISLFGWLVFIKGVLISFLPLNTIEKIIDKFNRPIFYNLAGILVIIIGLWLTYYGFII